MNKMKVRYHIVYQCGKFRYIHYRLKIILKLNRNHIHLMIVLKATRDINPACFYFLLIGP